MNTPSESTKGVPKIPGTPPAVELGALQVKSWQVAGVVVVTATKFQLGIPHGTISATPAKPVFSFFALKIRVGVPSCGWRWS